MIKLIKQLNQMIKSMEQEYALKKNKKKKLNQ